MFLLFYHFHLCILVHMFTSTFHRDRFIKILNFSRPVTVESTTSLAAFLHFRRLVNFPFFSASKIEGNHRHEIHTSPLPVLTEIRRQRETRGLEIWIRSTYLRFVMLMMLWPFFFPLVSSLVILSAIRPFLSALRRLSSPSNDRLSASECE